MRLRADFSIFRGGMYVYIETKSYSKRYSLVQDVTEMTKIVEAFRFRRHLFENFYGMIFEACDIVL